MIIPEHEYWFEYSSSPGPGGQNVNRNKTRATICFFIHGSGVLSPAQKQRLGDKLANRIGKDGVLRISCSESRTQKANRQQALERFSELINESLKVARKRRPTRPSLASKERRLQEKRVRSDTKKRRSDKEHWE